MLNHTNFGPLASACTRIVIFHENKENQNPAVRLFMRFLEILGLKKDVFDVGLKERVIEPIDMTVESLLDCAITAYNVASAVGTLDKEKKELLLNELDVFISEVEAAVLSERITTSFKEIVGNIDVKAYQKEASRGFETAFTRHGDFSLKIENDRPEDLDAASWCVAIDNLSTQRLFTELNGLITMPVYSCLAPLTREDFIPQMPKDVKDSASLSYTPIRDSKGGITSIYVRLGITLECTAIKGEDELVRIGSKQRIEECFNLLKNDDGTFRFENMEFSVLPYAL